MDGGGLCATNEQRRSGNNLNRYCVGEQLWTNKLVIYWMAVGQNGYGECGGVFILSFPKKISVSVFTLGRG